MNIPTGSVALRCSLVSPGELTAIVPAMYQYRRDGEDILPGTYGNGNWGGTEVLTLQGDHGEWFITYCQGKGKQVETPIHGLWTPIQPEGRS